MINLDSLESSTETSEILTDEQIFNLVSKEDVTLFDAEPVELMEETKIKTAEAKKSYSNLLNYFEQNDILTSEVLKSFRILEDKLSSKCVQTKLSF